MHLGYTFFTTMSQAGKLVLAFSSVFIYIGISASSQCCQNGWVTFGDSCYLFADETNLDWTEATHFCASHGKSHIVTLESQSEELFLRDQCRRLFKQVASRDNWFWLGATDDEVEGIWVWYTNHKLLSDGYTNWYGNEPATGSATNQDCAVLWGPKGYTWEDHICELKSHVICEKNSTGTFVDEIVG